MSSHSILPISTPGGASSPGGSSIFGDRNSLRESTRYGLGSISGRGGMRSGSIEGVDAYSLPRSERGVPLVLRRLLKFRSMDFETAFWQLTWLVMSPRRVYKATYHHKQTKNIWARDDPAMLILISGCVAATALAWSFAYHKTIPGTITTILLMIFRDFILTSLLTALILHFLANRLLLSSSTPQTISSTENRVEFAYAFDVAVNSFFPAFLTLYVALLALSSVVLRNNWVCLFFGNTLFLIAGIQYTYITYLGYAALPFVVRSEILLAPLLPIFGGYLLSLLGFNIPKHALEVYFGHTWA